MGEEKKSGQQTLSRAEEATQSENAEEIRHAVDSVQILANDLTKVMMGLPDETSSEIER